MISMKKDYDCGRAAAANLAEKLTGRLATTIYGELTGQPTWWPACDLWDSPTRMVRHLERLLSRPVGVIAAHDLIPCVVLVRVDWRTWHWITCFGSTVEGKLIWHSGRGLTMEPLPEEWRIELAIAPGGERLSWGWRLWGTLTSWL